MIIDTTIKIGDIITATSILVSLIAILIALSRDRWLRRREYADQIRQASGLVLAKLERWVELALTYYEDIQPSITSTDILIVEKQDVIAARDFFWKELMDKRAATRNRISTEEIGVAYKDLYGFDPKIHGLYKKALFSLEEVDEDIFNMLLEKTQKNILEIKCNEGDISSAKTGNLLRGSCAELKFTLAEKTEMAIVPIRDVLMDLVRRSDKDIVKGKRIVF